MHDSTQSCLGLVKGKLKLMMLLYAAGISEGIKNVYKSVWCLSQVPLFDHYFKDTLLVAYKERFRLR